MVTQVNPYRFGVPVLRFARQEAAPFQQQDSLSGRGQGVRQRPSSGAGSDDDYVVVIVHVSSPIKWSGQVGSGVHRIASGATHAPVAPRNLACEMTSRNSCARSPAISSRRRFSTTTTPCRTLSACGTANGSSARSGGNGP